MVVPDDIEVLERWLYLAKTIGTDAVKIVAGDEPNTYKVTVDDPGRALRKKGGK